VWEPGLPLVARAVTRGAEHRRLERRRQREANPLNHRRETPTAAIVLVDGNNAERSAAPTGTPDRCSDAQAAAERCAECPAPRLFNDSTGCGTAGTLGNDGKREACKDVETESETMPDSEPIEAFEKFVNGLRQFVVASANIPDGLEENVFGSTQRLLLSTIQQSTKIVDRRRLLSLAKPTAEVLVRIAERDSCALSVELCSLLAEMDTVGLSIARSPALPAAKPLASFPREFAVRHTVFVDETGNAPFDDPIQPVLSLVGVLVDDPRISAFNTAVDKLLGSFGVDPRTEVHAQAPYDGDGDGVGICIDWDGNTSTDNGHTFARIACGRSDPVDSATK
jgi:hypothetical protein